MRIDVPQSTLDDLARRLEAARWPDAYALDGGERRARLDRIKALLDRWRGDYDWRTTRRGSTSTSRTWSTACTC